MEKTYWLGRKRASLKAAQNAGSAESRLIHYDLAGRYSLKAVSAETHRIDIAAALMPVICTGNSSRTAQDASDA